jgi:hypothetical protein
MGGGRKGNNNNNSKQKGNKNKTRAPTHKKKTQTLKQSPPQQQQQQQQDSSSKWNFVSDAGPGCYIVRKEEAAATTASIEWMLGWEDIDPTDFEGDSVPDIAVDTEEFTLSLCNVDAVYKVAYITVYDTKLLGRRGQVLPQGSTTDNQGQTLPCITFIVLCPPHTFCHLCYIDVPPEQQQKQQQDEEPLDITDLLRIESDVQEWNQHPTPNDEHPQRLGFPLQCNSSSTSAAIPGDGNSSPTTSSFAFLCTQGELGYLTHFFSGNLHAIDFRCPIGTPLLAVANGIVVTAKDSNTLLTGIAVTNLFEWNSILLQLDQEEETKSETEDVVGEDTSNTRDNHHDRAAKGGPLFVEYVHIQSAVVKAGDRVSRGQVIGTSGSVGFSPEPHLHFSAFRSAAPDAPTVRVRFASSSSFSPSQPSTVFLPTAGNWYNDTGRVEAPAH